jgi:hypothetical protein
VSRTDKLAIICSALLLVAIIAAGGYGLRAAYNYQEPLAEEEAGQR